MVRVDLVRGNIERLLSDADAAFRQNDPAAGRLLINAVLALDPGNEDARRILEAVSLSVDRRRYARRTAGRMPSPLPVPGPSREYCETVLRREVKGFMAHTPTVWLEAYSVGRDGRRLVYSSGSWKAGRNAAGRYDVELDALIDMMVNNGWRLLPFDPEDMPRFQR
jgi:hypothetical protein